MEAQEPNVRVVETAKELWGLSLQPAGCSHCGQAYLVAEKQLGIYCPNCAQATLNAQPARLRDEPPEKIIPFQVQRAGLKTILTEFVQGVWLKFDDFNVESLLGRAVPVFIPIFVSAFRRAEDLAIALEARGFRGAPRRTRLHRLRLGYRDLAASLVVLAVILAAVGLDRLI